MPSSIRPAVIPIAMPPNIVQYLVGYSGADGAVSAENPNPALASQWGRGTCWTKRDTLTFGFELQGVAGLETEFIAQGFGNYNPSGAIERHSGLHDVIGKWEHPFCHPTLPLPDDGRIDQSGRNLTVVFKPSVLFSIQD